VRSLSRSEALLALALALDSGMACAEPKEVSVGLCRALHATGESRQSLVSSGAGRVDGSPVSREGLVRSSMR
jgi:hypothetical protein